MHFLQEGYSGRLTTRVSLVQRKINHFNTLRLAAF